MSHVFLRARKILQSTCCQSEVTEKKPSERSVTDTFFGTNELPIIFLIVEERSPSTCCPSEVASRNISREKRSATDNFSPQKRAFITLPVFVHHQDFSFWTLSIHLGIVVVFCATEPPRSSPDRFGSIFPSMTSPVVAIMPNYTPSSYMHVNFPSGPLARLLHKIPSANDKPGTFF